MIALIRLNPREIVRVYNSIPPFIAHPERSKTRLVSPAVVGWKGGGDLTYAPKLDDEGNEVVHKGKTILEASEGEAAFEIVDVVRAKIPAGKRIKGSPAYDFDAGGAVTEAVVLEDIPEPEPAFDARAEIAALKIRLDALGVL